MIGMGSKVMLNDKGRHKVPKEDEGKVFEVRSKPFEMFGTMCVLLKEKVGCYPIRDLTEVEEISGEGEELERYHSIGTVEECQEARERQKARKPNKRYKTKYIWDGAYCPICGCGITERWNCCQSCGQAIDWSNKDDR